MGAVCHRERESERERVREREREREGVCVREREKLANNNKPINFFPLICFCSMYVRVCT